ncbi:MAG TPA: PIN domain-containing protein [Candidatus Sulfotelmatobacter sp.]|nr:PIN domain-containing protein [Candidatus Sulfotelmatobacter sp.]
MEVILDTNAISALLEGDSALEAALAAEARHHLPVIVLGEYRYGLAASRRRKALEGLLDTLEKESIVLPVDAATARQYASVRRELKTSGKPIPENDVWVAALARQHRLAVVSRDAHFDAVRGLSRRRW